MPKYKKKSDAIFNCTFLSSTKSFISIDLKGREGSFIHLNHWRPRAKEPRSPELKLGLLWVAGLRVPNQHQQLLSGCTPQRDLGGSKGQIQESGSYHAPRDLETNSGCQFSPALPKTL